MNNNDMDNLILFIAELYGFDILIDADLKPWLLEVNLSPSLGCDSTFDMNVKSAMLADLLTLIGLPAVDPSSAAQTSSTGQRQGRTKTAPSQKERNQVLDDFTKYSAEIRKWTRKSTWK